MTLKGADGSVQAARETVSGFFLAKAARQQRLCRDTSIAASTVYSATYLQFDDRGFSQQANIPGYIKTILMVVWQRKECHCHAPNHKDRGYRRGVGTQGVR
jgi:hypothetical protein